MPIGMPPTTRVTISRTVQTDEYGDPVDLDQPPLYTDVPAVVAYDGRLTQDPATGTPRQVSNLSCILPKGTDVKTDDRVTDQQTGTTYRVTGVTLHPAYGVPGDVWIALEAVGG